MCTIKVAATNNFAYNFEWQKWIPFSVQGYIFGYYTLCKYRFLLGGYFRERDLKLPLPCSPNPTNQTIPSSLIYLFMNYFFVDLNYFSIKVQMTLKNSTNEHKNSSSEQKIVQINPKK